MTNGDRIRQMSDAEIGKFFVRRGTRNCPHGACPHMTDKTGCLACWLDWLGEELRNDTF